MPTSRYRLPRLSAFFAMGFRPFFLASGAYALIAVLLWVSVLRGVVELPILFAPVTWHFHEMMFGFVAAAIAGFLLTAIPNWTSRPPLQGMSLALLFLLWLAGRLAVLFAGWLGPVLSSAIDISFLIAFALIAVREILSARSWRNLPILAALSLLILANVLIHAGVFGYVEWEETGKRLALAVIIMLIAFIGGRIVPNFTANWLRRHNATKLPVPFGRFDVGVLLFSAFVLLFWVAVGMGLPSALLLLVAALAHALRLLRWRGLSTWREPLLWILHVGYAWLPVGLLLLGLSFWRSEFESIALHALTIGGMGTMILAVMTRASLGHSGLALMAGRGTLIIYLLVLASALVRLVGVFAGQAYALTIDLSGALWVAAFALFTILYLPLFLRR